MTETTGYFEEKEGVKSSTRLMTFTAAMAAIFIAVASVFIKEVTIGDALPIVLTLLSYSLGAKVFQKIAEVKK